MNRLNKIFQRKKQKGDCSGTTSANEEIEFQPASHDNDSHWSGTGSSGSNPSGDFDENDGVQQKSFLTKMPVANMSATSQNEKFIDENGETRSRKDSLSNKLMELMHGPSSAQSKKSHKQSSVESDVLDGGYGQEHLVPQATITRTSPKAPKKLIKPGETNVPQPAFLTNKEKNGMVQVTDEYTDPYDAVQANAKGKEKGHSALDGYIEPYKAQQMYKEMVHGNTSFGEMKSSISDSTGLHQKKDYDEPWDKGGKQGGKSEYEEPWDNSTATLPYTTKKHQRSFDAREFSSNNSLAGSGESSASSSSASLAKQRMVKVSDSPKLSPRSSPRNSPKMDRRLIRPKEYGSNSLYAAPGGGKSRPVDQRLIKAEPSLEELRRSSPSGSHASSATNSPLSSSHGSPLNTLSRSEAEAFDDLRRSSSPMMNFSHYLSKSKSRSLDIRNRQYTPHGMKGTKASIPKSASDDQLLQAALQGKFLQYKSGNQPLRGVTEYEEPWDGSENKRPMPNISHSRSRSYELDPSFSYCRPKPKHGKSYSFDKPEILQAGQASRGANYEQPWDHHDIVPQGHLESWQRFQHHQLELHPSEAISDRDCDPLLPLERQSWYHGAITRDEANRRLETQSEGSYLVRKSESIPNNYSLSLRTRYETIHMVVSRTRDGYWILGEFSAPFHSVPEMIAHYASHRLKINESHHISLRHPVPDEFL